VPAPRPLLEIFQTTARSLEETLALARVILKLWKEILPPPLAEKSWPLRCEGEILVIGVDSPIIAQELQFYLPAILEGLKGIIPGFSARRMKWELLEGSSPIELHTMEPPPPEFPDIPASAVDALPDSSPLKPLWLRLLALRDKTQREKGGG